MQKSGKKLTRFKREMLKKMDEDYCREKKEGKKLAPRGIRFLRVRWGN